LDYQEKSNYPFEQSRKNYDQHSEDDAYYGYDSAHLNFTSSAATHIAIATVIGKK